MKLKPDGIMIEMSEQEAGNIRVSYEELCWHMQNLLVELGSVQDNALRTGLYCTAMVALLAAYRKSITGPDMGTAYEIPNYRDTVERWIKVKFDIPHYADILPRTKVRGVATGDGSFELMENQ